MKTNPKNSSTVDNQAIIDRGYTLEEEYDNINSGNKLEKLNIGVGSHERLSETEGIWIYSLEPDKSNQAGQPFHFVFFNQPICFLGCPRGIAGMVGVAVSHGVQQRATALVAECIAMFKKTGKPAIDYYHRNAKK